MPSKRQVLDFIESSAGPVGKRDIARAFQLDGDQKVALKTLLRELKEDGLVSRGAKRRVGAPGALPQVAVIEIASLDLDGELFAVPAKWDGEGAPPAILVTPGPGGAPKVGDRVLARLNRLEAGLYDAKPIRVLGRERALVLGVLEADRDGALLRAVERKGGQTYLVARDKMGEAGPGDIVQARPLPGRRGRLHEAQVVERIGRADAPRAFSLIAIRQYDIPHAFSERVLEECRGLTVPPLGARADLRDLPLVTIDGADARDFDDAVHAQPDDDPGNPGGMVAHVAIADVAHYVKPDGALDRAAERRGNSVYFPDRVVPMLPEALSNELCSLKPGVERACLAVRMRIDPAGRLIGWRFQRGLMRSTARLTYEQVQAARDGAPDETTAPLLATVIDPLYRAYGLLATARTARGTLELDIPERRIEFAADGTVAAIGARARLDSHRLIEEFMIAANVAAAEALEKRQAPALYRIHEPPGLDKLEALRESLAALGLKLAKGNRPTPRLFSGLLAQAHGTEKAEIVSTLILRAQSQARYSPENAGHFGLALTRYCHFTSPIRRYADVLVHRALIGAYRLGDGALPPGQAERFEETGEAISGTERRAAAAERDVMDRYTTAFLAERVGAEFQGRINGVTHFGLFVTLDETGADGLVPVTSLPRDYYDHDQVSHALVGRDNALAFTLGERVTVRLEEAQPISGGMVFSIVEGGRVLKTRPRMARGKAGPRGRRAGPRGPAKGYRKRR